MQKKKRVYELAREFGKTDKEVLEVLKKNNIDVTSRLSSVDDNGHAVLAKAFAAKKKPARRPMIRTVRFDQQGRPTDRKNREVKQQSSYSSIEVPEEPKPAPKPVKKAEEPKPAPKAEAKPARRAEEPRQERKENRSRDEKNFHTRDSRNERQGERNRSDRPHQDRRPNDRNSRPAPVEEKPAATQRREKPAKKKTKKDWERSRREKEGGSLMARSLNQTKKKKHMAEKKPSPIPQKWNFRRALP